MILPPSPLRLKSSFVLLNQIGGIALLLGAAAIATAFGWLALDEVKQLRREEYNWMYGDEARFPHVSGEVKTSKFIFNTYKLDVSYMDAKGGRHQYDLEFDTLFTKVDETSPVEIRYLADKPSEFALSWALSVKGSRWSSTIFLFVVGVGLLGGTVAGFGVYALRLLGNARRCARRSDEVLVQVTKTIPQTAKGKVTGIEFHYEGAMPDGRRLAGKASFPIKHPPFFADASQQVMVARVAQETLQRPVIVRDDFFPFDLSAAEQAAARAAVQPSGPQEAAIRS